MLATLLVAGMAFVSCEKENGPVEGTFTMSVNAVKGGSNASKALTVDGDAINATWTKDDVVKVYKSGAEVGSLTAASSGASTKLNGSITGSIAQGDNLTLEFLSPDYQNGQDGTLDYIAAHCDYAVANVTVASISGDEIRITGNSATFENQQAIVKFTLQDKAKNANLIASAFSVEVDGYIYAVVPASATNEFYVALPAISNKKVSLFAKTDAGWYSYGQTGIIFAKGQYYTISAKLVQTGKLPGVFSIDGSNTVHFSQGNLKYDGTNWSFHTNQYDMVNTSNGTQSGYPMDLFFWGGSSKDYGATNAYTSDESESADDVVNWGDNAISNGGNVANAYSTPSTANWIYLFNTRTDANSKYGTATVTTVGTQTGVVVLPDHWTLPTGCSFTSGISSWSNNSYDATAWAKMEAAGAVFLPAAGGRDGTDVLGVGGIGVYWSSTAENAFYARNVYFEGGFGLEPGSSDNRNVGQSVRLVCE